MAKIFLTENIGPKLKSSLAQGGFFLFLFASTANIVSPAEEEGEEGKRERRNFGLGGGGEEACMLTGSLA